MTRTGKVISWVVGVIIILLIAIVIFIAMFDWNRLKPTINQKSVQNLTALSPSVAIWASTGRVIKMKRAGVRGCPGRTFMRKISCSATHPMYRLAKKTRRW